MSCVAPSLSDSEEDELEEDEVVVKEKGEQKDSHPLQFRKGYQEEAHQKEGNEYNSIEASAAAKHTTHRRKTSIHATKSSSAFKTSFWLYAELLTALHTNQKLIRNAGLGCARKWRTNGNTVA